jgi:NADH-quinone oxidoreductase subunit K
MAVAAAEVSVGLAIIVMVYKNLKTTNIDMFNRLKG